jgi:hypothetical protein
VIPCLLATHVPQRGLILPENVVCSGLAQVVRRGAQGVRRRCAGVAQGCSGSGLSRPEQGPEHKIISA